MNSVHVSWTVQKTLVKKKKKKQQQQQPRRDQPEMPIQTLPGFVGPQQEL